MIPTLQTILSDTNTSVIKTDNSGIEWVRVGFLINQTNTPGGASVNVQDLKVLYELEHKIGQTDEFASYLREFVAVNNQGASQSNSGQILIPIETRSENGGQLSLSNLSIITQSGYDSTLVWNGDYEGLYSNGELYHITTTHSVDPSTGASLSACKITFKQMKAHFLVYDANSGWTTGRITIMLPSIHHLLLLLLQAFSSRLKFFSG